METMKEQKQNILYEIPLKNYPSTEYPDIYLRLSFVDNLDGYDKIQLTILKEKRNGDEKELGKIILDSHVASELSELIHDLIKSSLSEKIDNLVSKWRQNIIGSNYENIDTV